MNTIRWLPAVALTWGIAPVLGALVLGSTMGWWAETVSGLVLAVLTAFAGTYVYLTAVEQSLETARKLSKSEGGIGRPNPGVHVLIAAACCASYLALTAQAVEDLGTAGVVAAGGTTLLIGLVLGEALKRLKEAGGFGNGGQKAGTPARE